VSSADDIELAVIVGAARSGTTLLRLILDAHPDIGCPAEAGLPGLMSHMAGVWITIDADVTSDVGDDAPFARHRTEPDGRVIAARAAEDGANGHLQEAWSARIPVEAQAWIRQAITTTMSRYCARGEKRLYADKSLDSVYHLPLVHRLFPEARYVLLFRHVMDAVASGIEASPWGFHAYGYGPFVQRSPDNFVAALVDYWLAHVDSALKWEEEHSELCHRVRYEDLVTNPATVVAEIFAFLGVEHDASVLKRAFSRVRSIKGPGDYKVIFTSAVDPASIGRGKRVPVDMVPPPLLEAANEKLKALGYEPLDRSWNAEPPDTKGQARELSGWGVRLAELVSRVRLPASAGRRPVDSFALVAQDHANLRWVVDLGERTIRQGDGEVECVITGTAQDLASLLSGDSNAGALLRAGRIRHLGADENSNDGEVFEAVRVVLDTLGQGSVRVDRERAPAG
jgi:protein-tyrosine sulfotransferase